MVVLIITNKGHAGMTRRYEVDIDRLQVRVHSSTRHQEKKKKKIKERG